MKRIKLILSSVFLLAATCIFHGLHAQDLDEAKVNELVAAKNFVFKAQSVTPLGAPSKQLTSDYDLKLKNDSMVVYLPYFGRSYAPVDPNEGGIHFTSTKFEYKAKARKKGGWTVTISPKDTKDVRELNFTISSAGYTTLQVTSNNRQSISFNGYLEETK